VWLPPLVAVVVLVVIWQLVAVGHRYVLPRPRAVLLQLVHHPGSFAHSGWVTLSEALLGLVIGCGAAFVLATLMSQLKVVERAVLPLAVVLNVTPVVAIAPALQEAFGFGRTPKVLVAAVICFFPTLIGTTAGLRASDPAVVDVLRTLHASRSEILWRVQLPSSLPYLFAVARVCLPLSVVGAVVAEFVAQGSTSGLGTMISQAASNAQLDRVYAAIVCLGIIGVALVALVSVVERRALRWQRPSRPGR
jgi:NitT/TauT family transport system permease protein